MSLSAKKLQLLLSFGALGLSLIIVGVSLVAADPVLSLERTNSASQRHFYMGQDILPDHIFYPLLMMADRIRLDVADDEKQMQIRVNYAWQRLHHAQMLIEKKQPALALTTITKSQKYMIYAVQDALDAGVAVEEKKQLLSVLKKYCLDVKKIASNFTDSQKAMIDKLITECEILIVSLESSS